MHTVAWTLRLPGAGAKAAPASTSPKEAFNNALKAQKDAWGKVSAAVNRTKQKSEQIQRSEQALAKLKEHPLTLTNGTTLRVDTKKGARQLQRNYSLTHAEELLKNHPANAQKNVHLNWKLQGSSTRNVTVNDVPAFTQLATDTTGTFSPDFHTLTF